MAVIVHPKAKMYHGKDALRYTTLRDNEDAYVSVNDKVCWIKTDILATRGTQQCGGRFKEERFRVTGCYVTLPETSEPTVPLTVRVWTNLDGEADDESFGIDNVVISEAVLPVDGGTNNRFGNQNNFEGWNCDKITTCGDLGQICGGYNVKGKGSDLIKTYRNLPAGKYSVQLDVIKVDSWFVCMTYRFLKRGRV